MNLPWTVELTMDFFWLVGYLCHPFQSLPWSLADLCTLCMRGSENSLLTVMRKEAQVSTDPMERTLRKGTDLGMSAQQDLQGQEVSWFSWIGRNICMSFPGGTCMRCPARLVPPLPRDYRELQVAKDSWDWMLRVNSAAYSTLVVCLWRVVDTYHFDKKWDFEASPG